MGFYIVTGLDRRNMPQNEAGKLRYRPQYCGAVARRKPRPTLVAMAGHCYRQMKDVVVNDKVHRGHSSELKELL